MKCNQDCFHCIYPDCIEKDYNVRERNVVKTTGKQGRKRFTAEELRQHKLEYNRLYRVRNREQIAERRKKKRDEAKKRREGC